MNYCSECGGRVALQTPRMDTQLRHVCQDCSMVHYQNPRIVAGCIPEWQDGRVLLCKRAIEPRAEYWTLPAGFLELGESLLECVLRETWEEARAKVAELFPCTVLSIPYAGQVHILFRARLCDMSFAPGPESRAVELFEEQAIPWDQLAFSSVHHTLKYYFSDRQTGCHSLHLATLRKEPEGYVLDEDG